MRSIVLYVALLPAVWGIGCASSSPVEQPAAPPLPARAEPDTLSDLSAPLPDLQEPEPPETDLLAGAVTWTPRFVPTGLASGIMVEFTGIKKGKTLRAKYANIELRRYLPDSLQEGGPVPALGSPMRSQTTINNLHQAFFKVQPGTYFFRVTNPWADRKMLREMVVREGEYSVVSNDVYAAWLRRSKEPADSSEAKP